MSLWKKLLFSFLFFFIAFDGYPKTYFIDNISRRAFGLHVRGYKEGAFKSYYYVLRVTRINRYKPYKSYYYIGKSFEILGDYDNAVSFFERSYKWAKYFRDKIWENRLLLSLAFVDVKKGFFSAGEKRIRKLFISDYDNRILYVVIKSLILSGRKDLGEALKVLKGYEHPLVWTQRGDIYKTREEYDTALLWYNKALEYYNKNLDLNGRGRIYNSMAICFLNKKEYKKAEDIFKKAYRDYSKVDNKSGISAVYTNYGSLKLRLGDEKGALNLFKKALILDFILANDSLIAIDYFNIAKLMEDSEPDKALKYYFKSLEIDRRLGNFRSLKLDYYAIGKLFLKLGNKKKAHKFLYKAYSQAIFLGDYEEANYLELFIRSKFGRLKP